MVTDPLNGQPFPGNKIPTSRMDPRGVAFLNLFPLPNRTAILGYKYVTQEASIPHPRRQHIFRGNPNGQHLVPQPAGDKARTWRKKDGQGELQASHARSYLHPSRSRPA